MSPGYRNSSIGKTAFLAVFITIYFFSAIRFDALHVVLHDNHVEHTEESELDPCHRTIFHNAKQDGCEHTAHFTQELKCDICSIILIDDQHASSGIHFKEIGATQIYYIHPNWSFNDRAPLSLSSRGPPQS